MKMEILSEKDNPLRKRKRYWISVEHAGKETPSRHDVHLLIAKKLGTKPELTIISKIFSERGNPKSSVKVLIFSDKKDIPLGMNIRHERKVKSFLEKKSKNEAEAASKEEEQSAEEKTDAPQETEAGPKPEEKAPEADEESKEDAPAEEATETKNEDVEHEDSADAPKEEKAEEKESEGDKV